MDEDNRVMHELVSYAWNAFDNVYLALFLPVSVIIGGSK